MDSSQPAFMRNKARYPTTITIETTLYDLIEAISDETRAGEDSLIAQTVNHLIYTGKLKFVGFPEELDSIYA